MAHQTPDDFICSPADFRRYHKDGTVETTFKISEEWQLTTAAELGELVVRESAGSGPLVKILLEPERNDLL